MRCLTVRVIRAPLTQSYHSGLLNTSQISCLEKGAKRKPFFVGWVLLRRLRGAGGDGTPNPFRFDTTNYFSVGMAAVERWNRPARSCAECLFARHLSLREIIRTGRTPADLIIQNVAFLPEIVGFAPARKVYAHIFIAAARSIGVPAGYGPGTCFSTMMKLPKPTTPGRKYSSKGSGGWLSTFPMVFARQTDISA